MESQNMHLGLYTYMDLIYLDPLLHLILAGWSY